MPVTARLAPTGLPVEEVVPELRAALASPGAAVLQAEPGAGKTTVVPLRLLEEPWNRGRILVLEPRRVAARAAAARMAELLGEKVGATVGYVTRDDRRVGPDGRIEVVTDGILTRRLQRDPGLAGVALVVFDEFHERHLQGDLGLALTLDARQGLRPDLRVLVMSATVEGVPVAALLGGAPLVVSTGRAYPVELRWRPGRPGARLVPAVTGAIGRALERDPGDVLAFLPGVGEIRAAAGRARHPGGGGRRSPPREPHRRRAGPGPARAAPKAGGARHGPGRDERDRRGRGRGGGRRAGPATRVRPGERAHPTADGPDLACLGRPAGGPGRADRPRGRLPPLVSDRAAWPDGPGRTRRSPSSTSPRWRSSSPCGARPSSALAFLDPPPAAPLATARQLLEVLGALEAGRPTALGRRLAELPVHPRLGRMLLAAGTGELRVAALLAALVAERDVLVGRRPGERPSADVALRLAVLEGGPGDGSAEVDRAAVATVRRRAGELARRVERSGGTPPRRDAAGTAGEPGPLLAEAYPDRLAQARGPGRYRLRHGAGAALPDHDPLAGAPWLVAAEVEGAGGGTGRGDGLIRLAASLERDEVERIGGDAVRTTVRLEWDPQLDDLRATTERSLDALVLETASGPATPGPDTAAALLAHVTRAGLAPLGWSPGARALQARAGWARRVLGEGWPDVADAALAARAEEWLVPLLGQARGRADLQRIDPSTAVTAALGHRRAELDRLVPAAVELASGRRRARRLPGGPSPGGGRGPGALRYLGPSERGGGTVPLTLELLSPAGRPVQITADLPGFWAGTWREVRKEMATRYPKHLWPEDPASASPPTRRAGPRRGR